MVIVATDWSRSVWLLIGLLGVILIGNIDIAITNIAMPAIHSDLHASDSEMELVVSGYTLAYAIMLIPSARFAVINFALSGTALLAAFCAQVSIRNKAATDP